MSAFTTNYNLIKPTGTEDFSVNHQNDNMDIIDAALGNIPNLTLITEGTSNNIQIGQQLNSKANNIVVGLYNNATNTTAIEDLDSNTDSGTVFVVGCGTSTTGKNAFRITKNSLLYAASSISTTGADYAEYFEWLSIPNDDPVGRMVTLDGQYIRYANAGEWVLGVISSNACFIGDGQDEEWTGMYQKDVFGRKIIVNGEYVINPEYDANIPFLSRENRPEWITVGLVGKLVVIDDGTALINEFVKAGNNGIATAANVETRFRVMKRLDENHILVVCI